MVFSQRKGIQPIEVPIQVESMDNGLRNGLWSAILTCFLSSGVVRHDYNKLTDGCSHGLVLQRLWHDYFKRPLDEYPHQWDEFVVLLRNYFFQCEWYEVYDFIEALISSFDGGSEHIVQSMTSFMNSVMERDNSGYRIVDGKVTDLTDETTTQNIEVAAKQIRFSGASAHIKTSIGFLFHRTEPDYRNAIKEAISAVESACVDFTGDTKSTLGKAVNKLQDDGYLHPAMKEALSKLYGYTSDESGIRHAIIDHSNATKEDAVFMLSVCSAYINYLVARSS